MSGDEWVDPDDAPEWTAEQFERADLYHGNKLVRAGRPLPCRHCNEVRDGVFSRATYAGAPDGGVLVHTRCLTEFYAALDKKPYRY